MPGKHEQFRMVRKNREKTPRLAGQATVRVTDLINKRLPSPFTRFAEEEYIMGNTKKMSEETKAKIAMARAANKAQADAMGITKAPRASLDDQIAGMQAQADAGDAAAVALMPVIDVYRERLAQAKADAKVSAKKLRKLLSA